MEFTKSGAYRMVKKMSNNAFNKMYAMFFKVLFIVVAVSYSSRAHAEYLVGVSTNSWQESIPIVNQNVQSSALSSFSSIGFSLGYQYNYSKQIRFVSSLAYLLGSVDVHKQLNAIAPRKNFTSYWFSNKAIWSHSRYFTYGPNLVINYRNFEATPAVLNYGVFLDIDYDLFEEVRLTQSLGTMSDSKQIAYSISLNRIF